MVTRYHRLETRRTEKRYHPDAIFATGCDGEHQHIGIEMDAEMQCSKEQSGNKETDADIKNVLVM
jgi:hypothetical protein